MTDQLTINRQIRLRRDELELSDVEVAARSGLSIDEYFDVELHEDEATTVVPIGSLRRLCEVLGLRLASLLGLECPQSHVCHPANDSPSRSRSELIVTSRKAANLSQLELGDLIGFEAFAIGELEQSEEAVDAWSFALLERLANALRIPTYDLLGSGCAKCAK